jgi:putative membrane protein
LLLTDSIMGSSFEIDSFGMALLIAVIMSFVNMIVQSQTTKSEKRK